jgi:3-oxoacyl-[acyl-carrier protein] reductase
MADSLSGKVALVTGASRGIGAEIARSLAAAGAAVVVNYASSAPSAEQVVSDITRNGGQALAVRADVASPADVRAMFDATIERFGSVNILVNNAGILFNRLISQTTDEEFERIFAINVRGVFNTLREAATRLADNGRVINFSTSVTRLMLPTYGPYAATKGAVEQLTRVFAKEVGQRGITANVVSPGPTNTELFTEGKTPADIQRLAQAAALGRIGEPSDIAKLVVFLATDQAGWISAQNIGANGGFA